MNATQLIDALNGSVAASGGTSQGISADIRAISCGMAAAFSESVVREGTRFPEATVDGAGKPHVVGTRAGSAFHALQELWRQERLDPAALPLPETFKESDPAIGAALMAFKRYIGENHLDPHYFGETLAVEFEVAGKLAGYARTGRIDQVVRVDAIHADRFAQFGLFALVPGVYLWDYKLLQAVSASSADGYARSMQAMAYVELYEQTTGVRPEGFIFEMVSRALKPKDSRLFALAPNGHDNLAIVAGFVAEAQRRREEGRATPTNGDCSSRYGSCPFTSVCPRFGTAKQHQNIISNYAQLRTVVYEDEAA